ncbi:Nitrogen regulatory protein P-II [Glycine max]|nr:Nitrogen regulatory protein P-II [Glycine max]
MTAIAGTHVFGVVSFQLKQAEMPFACSCLIRKRIGDSPQRNVALRRRVNGTILPQIRAQNLPDYVPKSEFYKVEAILRLQAKTLFFFCGSGSFLDSKALLKMGIRGVTVSDVRGFGAQGGSKERQGGSEFSEDNFVAKVKMEVVVRKDQVEAVIDKIIEEARTGEIGDGKIFLIPISDVIRIRTGERGEQAARMTGGRSDMLSAV